MTALFGIPLLLGFLMMLAWLVATAIAATVSGWERVDPERVFGRTGRAVLASVIGFGMSGISALYAGWPHLASVAAGAVGAAGLIAVSFWLGPESES